MEPAQRCVPGPGAWVDCGECFFSFREGEVEFFFFFKGERAGESRRSTCSEEVSSLVFSPCFA